MEEERIVDFVEEEETPEVITERSAGSAVVGFGVCALAGALGSLAVLGGKRAVKSLKARRLRKKEEKEEKKEEQKDDNTEA